MFRLYTGANRECASLVRISMIFSSLQYLLFLPVVAFLYWRTTGGARLALVVIASYIFYMSWFPVYGLLLLFLTAANWVIALFLAKTRVGRSRHEKPTVRERTLLAAGLILNLGCLCYYKYTNFILGNLLQLAHLGQHLIDRITGANASAAGNFGLHPLNVILPLGISFFVFEFVHYIVDVYSGSKPIKSFMEFAAFASFFPSQIAGPIKRYQEFNVRLRSPEPWSSPLFFEAMTLIVRGLFKKVAIADPIGFFVYRAFGTLIPMSTGDSLLSMVLFVVQVYCDFSGYTDIGRGSALLLGIRLPENFELPYLAHDLADFWRRWHMSLSYWLRDYVYIPLGGSRKNKFANWRNLFITMVVCGLWHGASWHYVVFGALQGLGLIVNREWKTLLKRTKPLSTAMETWIGKAFGTVLTMAFITLTYAVFRAPDLPHAGNILSSMFNFGGIFYSWAPVLRSGVFQFTGVYAAFWLLEEWARRKPEFFSRLLENKNGAYSFTSPVRFASWTAAIILTIAARPTEAVPFVYFQF